jgi:hypothetical protein
MSKQKIGVIKSAQPRFVDFDREKFANSNFVTEWSAIDETPVEIAPEIEQERSWTQAAGDTLLGATRSTLIVPKVLGAGYGLATGKMNNYLLENADRADEILRDNYSDPLKKKIAARDKKIKEADGIVDTATTAFGETVGDGALALDTVASNIGSLVTMGGVGAAAKLAVAGRGLRAAQAVGPASQATLDAVGATAAKIGTRTALGAGATLQGADVAADVYKSALAKPDEAWAQNQKFMDAVAKTDGSDEAVKNLKHEFALDAARVAFPAAAGVSLATSKIAGGSAIENALVNGLGKTAGKGGFMAGVGAAAKTLTGETVSEGLEEGGGAIAGNLAKQQFVDPNQDLTEKVGENTGMGAAGGFLMGGIPSAMQGYSAYKGDEQNQLPVIGEQKPAIPPTNPLNAVQQSAQQPGSVLSRAAMAGNQDTPVTSPVATPTVAAATQATAQSATPTLSNEQIQFADLLDTDDVYDKWSNVRDGSDREEMRTQMEYISGQYLDGIKNQGLAPDVVKADLKDQFKWFKSATPEQQDQAVSALYAQVGIPTAPTEQPTNEDVNGATTDIQPATGVAGPATNNSTAGLGLGSVVQHGLETQQGASDTASLAGMAATAGEQATDALDGWHFASESNDQNEILGKQADYSQADPENEYRVVQSRSGFELQFRPKATDTQQVNQPVGDNNGNQAPQAFQTKTQGQETPTAEPVEQDDAPLTPEQITANAEIDAILDEIMPEITQEQAPTEPVFEQEPNQEIEQNRPEPVNEPHWQEAQTLQKEQVKATGNAVKTGKMRVKVRNLAKKVKDGTKTALLLDTIATRLDMGEGKVKGIEFAAAENGTSTISATEETKAPESQLVQDFIDGKTDTPPSVEDVKNELAANANANVTDANLAPGTRINGKREKDAADRLELLLAQMGNITKRETPEGAAKGQVRSLIEELRKERTAVSVVPILEEASQRLARNYGAFSRVLDEVAESLSDTAQPNDTPSDRGMTLLEARNALIEVNTRIANQGMVSDDRLLEKKRKIEKLIAQLQAEQQATEKQQNTEPTILDVGIASGRVKVVNVGDKPVKQEAKAEPKVEPKADPLDAQAKAAKAKMFNALSKLASMAGKNTRMNWTPEEEQQLLPVVIELFDGAMELGQVTFKKAVRYVREFIASGIDQETADSIPYETLQGAYIAATGRHKDKSVTPLMDVAKFASIEDVYKDDESTAAPAETPVAENNDLPEGWTEAKAGGMATNTDPVSGGIVDRELINTPKGITEGKWFAISNANGKLDGVFETRADAIAAIANAASKPAETVATPLVTHITSKGKEIKGVIRTDLTLDQAKSIDPYTFKKDGGFFIREKHLDELNAAFPLSKATSASNEVKPSLGDVAGRLMVSKAVADHLITDRFATIVQARQFITNLTGETIEPGTPLAKRADEAIELGVVIASRDIVDGARKQGRSDEVIFDRLLQIYENQPGLNVKDSTSLNNQAYSTPVPLAFVASRLAQVSKDKMVGEPTAGNGALMMEADPATAMVNEFEPNRIEALRSTGFNPTTNDAAAMEFPPKSLDSMVMNPPFGSLVDGTEWTFGEFTTNQIDHAIVLNSLEALKDDGNAVLIIGGTLARDSAEDAHKQAYRGIAKRSFFANLYSQYNVVDHFSVSGDLYRKQGAGFPVDVLVIRGRGKSNRPLPQAELPKKVDTWAQLKEKLNEQSSVGTIRQPNIGGDSGERGASPQPGPVSVDTNGASGSTSQGGTEGRSGSVSTPNGSGSTGSGTGSNGVSRQTNSPEQRGNDNAPESQGNTGTDAEQGHGKQSDSNGNPQRNNAAGLGNGTGSGARTGLRLGGVLNVKGSNVASSTPKVAENKQSDENALQVPYDNFSENKSVNTLVATNHLGAIKEAFSRLMRRLGISSIDEYVRNELQYDPELFKASFSAEQVEALALAIDNIKRGKGFIIGDQTGIGKGRVVAAMIRYAKINGKTPVFVTQMPDLYGDMMRDLSDIGMGSTKPLMTNNNASVPLDAEALDWFSEKQAIQSQMTELQEEIDNLAKEELGGKLKNLTSEQVEKEVKKYLKTAKNPEILSLKEEVAELKDSIPARRGKFLETPNIEQHEESLRGMVNGNSIGDYDVIFTTYNQLAALDSGLPKADKETGQKTPRKAPVFGYRNKFLEHFVNKNAMLILDESHNAGAADARNPSKLGNVVRDFIERAGSVFYSSATFAKNTNVMDAYSKTDLGLSFRTADDITQTLSSLPMQQVASRLLVEAGQYLRRERSFAGIDYETNEVVVSKQDTEDLGKAMSLMVAFDDAKKDAIKNIQNELDREGSVIKAIDGGGSQASVDSLNFTSVMHNVVNTFLLALKADATAQTAIDAISKGEKPVITVANTMEMFINEFAADRGLGMGDKFNATYADVLRKYLENTRKAKTTDANGNSNVHYLTDEELGSDGVDAYNDALDFIDSLELDVPISPIDHIKQRIEEAGYSIGEITGRQTVVVNGVLRPRNKAEQKTAGKKNTIAKFNNGGLDALIINRSGSTGLSMHASEKFGDQRRRVMIIGQAELDINNHMQMLGRINRTGQVTQGPFDDDTGARRVSFASRARMAMQKAARIGALREAANNKVYGGKSPYRASLTSKRIDGDLALAELPKVPEEDTGRQRYYKGKAASYGLPHYYQMTADVPIELRPAAVLAKKMAALNANTTADKKSAVEAGSLDFMNKYGDLVAVDVLMADPGLNAKLGFPVRVDVNGDIDPKGVIAKVTGRVGLLPLKDQSDLYQKLATEYKLLIEQLDAMGMNDLEAKTYPLDAKLIKTEELLNGTDDSPFTSAVTAESVNVRKLGKPYSSEKVRELIDKTLGGAVTRAASDAHYNATLDKYYKRIQSEIAAFEQVVAANESAAAVANAKTRIEKLKTNQTRFREVLQSVGLTKVLKTDSGNFYGVVTDVFHSGDQVPTALSAWKVRFAVVDGAKSITLPFTKIYTTNDSKVPEGGTLVDKATEMMLPTADRTSFESVSIFDAFDRGQTDSRENRVIVTGNLLRAAANGVKGRIMNYTDENGVVKQGILLPPTETVQAIAGKFTPSINTYEQLETVISNDGMAIDKKENGDVVKIVKSWGDSVKIFLGKALGKKLVKLYPSIYFASAGGRFTAQAYRGEELKKFFDFLSDQDNGLNQRIELVPDGKTSKKVKSGEIRFSRKPAQTDIRMSRKPVDQSVIDGFIDKINGVRQAAGEARISVVTTPAELPVKILEQAELEQIPHNEIHGVLYKGHAYIVRQNLKTSQDVEEVLLHEVLGHGGVNALLGKAKNGVLLESFERSGGITGLRKAAVRLGVYKEFSARIPNGELSVQQKIAVVDELLALAQGKTSKLQQLALEWWNKFRNQLIAALNGLGFTDAAEKLDGFDAGEVAVMLRQMREAVIDGGDIGGNGVVFMSGLAKTNKVNEVAGSGNGMPQVKVREIVDVIRSTWKNSPDVVVASNMNDPIIPQAVRDADRLQKSQGAVGDAEGFVYGGKVYVVASEMNAPQDVVRVLFHEALGHMGLRGVYGNSLKQVLNQVILGRRKEVIAKAISYGLDPSNNDDLLQAAEEVLAEMAQTRPELGFVQRAIAAIRNFLRTHVPMFKNMEFSDADIIQAFILPARRFVENGGGDGGGGGLRYLRAFHGTPHNGIEKFNTEKIGTGEGAQAYGWGLYFASKKEIAEWYRNSLSTVTPAHNTFDGKRITKKYLAELQQSPEKSVSYFFSSKAANRATGITNIAPALDDVIERKQEERDYYQERLDSYLANPPFVSTYNADYYRDQVNNYDKHIAGLEALKGRFGFKKQSKNGQLYEVEIPEEGEMLDWDKPLSEQPEGIRKALEQILASDAMDEENKAVAEKAGDGITGRLIYSLLETSDNTGSARAASLALANAGIKGIKYLDGTTRNSSKDSHNYVIFDGADVAIEKTHFSRNGQLLAPNGKPSKLSEGQWHQVRSTQFKAWFGDWESAAILNGEALATLKTSDAPTGGFKDVEDWAASVFAKQGGKAVRAGIGEILLDHRAAQTSMAHGGATKYKKVAFAAVKDVIERGALVHQSSTPEEDSFYFSAPVDIDGVTNIETVLVHRDVNTKRMYLHSVTTKENLLNQRVSSADAEAPKRSGSTNSEGIAILLQNIINRKGISKAVDPETGEPMVVYHGTLNDISTFAPSDFYGSGYFGKGINLTSSAQDASKYASKDVGVNHDLGSKASVMAEKMLMDYTEAKELLTSGNGTVYPLFSSMKNPLRIDSAQLFVPEKVLRTALSEIDYQDDPDVFIRQFNRSGDGIKQFQFVQNSRATQIYRQIASIQNKDGLIIDGSISPKSGGAVHLIALDSTQIKSAIGNNGDFDGNNPDIRFSRTPLANANFSVGAQRTLQNSIMNRLNDLWRSSAKVSWWDKTVGTQYHLSERNSDYKRTFNAVQNFLSDTSIFANKAADLAPKMLPKLDKLKDLVKKALPASDVKAVSSAVFGGTLYWARDKSGNLVPHDDLLNEAAKMSVHDKADALMRYKKISPNVLKMWQGMPIEEYESLVGSKYEKEMLPAGVVFTPDELRKQFGMTEEQIGLYQEFRKATNRSLTDLAVSEMVRMGGADLYPISEIIMEHGDVKKAADEIRAYLDSMMQSVPERADEFQDTINKVDALHDRAVDLMNRGYAPLMRFGKYAVYAKGSDGEQLFFGMYESQREANWAETALRNNYPNAQISSGIMSQEQHKLFQGVTPETLALFGDAMGLDTDSEKAAAYQEFIKLVADSRSTLRRMLNRKGVAGYSEDATRVLAGFITSNSRKTASNLNNYELSKSVEEIKAGDVKDAAIKLKEYVQNPEEEAQWIRGALFTQYIGGSVASAMVNLTQSLTMTFPYLSQFTSVADAGARMASAAKMAGTGKGIDDELKAALKRAEDDGVVAPQEIHQLMAHAQGKGGLKSGDGTTTGDALAAGSNALSKLALLWGNMFSAAEVFNRNAAFIAAYQLAKDKNLGDPFAFAEKTVKETQGIYNKGNKPAWARGAVGSVLFTFKQFSISYVEFLQRMYANDGRNGQEGKKAMALALGVLMLTAGVAGLPGGDDLDDVIDAFAQLLGYNFSSDQAKQEFLLSVTGSPAAAQFVLHGLSGLPGSPIDVSGRMGLGNLIPGTGFLLRKDDHTRDVAELFGPIADLAKRSYSAGGEVLRGNVVDAAKEISPVAARNVLQGVDMLKTGMYRDAKDNKVIETDTTDAIAKMVGFQPNDVAKVQKATFTTQRMVATARMVESEIVHEFAVGRFERDQSKIDAARKRLQKWNEKNPSTPIRITVKQVNTKVQNMNKTKAQRMAAAAPKEVRAAVQRELAGF